MAGISLLLAVGAIILALVATIHADRARHSMSLVDSAGRERIRLIAGEDGGRIELLAKDGKPRVSIRQDADKISLELSSAHDGHANVLGLSVREDAGGGASIHMHSREKAIRWTTDLRANMYGAGLNTAGPAGKATLESDPASTGLTASHAGQHARLLLTSPAAQFQLGEIADPRVDIHATPDHTSLKIISADKKGSVELSTGQAGSIVVADGHQLYAFDASVKGRK